MKHDTHKHKLLTFVTVPQNKKYSKTEILIATYCCFCFICVIDLGDPLRRVVSIIPLQSTLID